MMRLHLFMLAGLALSTTAWAFAPQGPNFVPCEKTYISPQEVVLEENTIHIETNCLSGKTSAIYSDVTGLYYKDLLEDIKEEPIAFEDFFEEDMFSIYSDEFPPHFNDELLVLISDEPLTFEQPLTTSEPTPIAVEESAPPEVIIDTPIAQSEVIIDKPVAQSEVVINKPTNQLTSQPQQPSRPPSSWPYTDKKW